MKDNGIGIDPTHLPKLFEMFSQATSALDRAGGGLGIGLALARGLVEAHGGRVEAHSAGLGTGSEFILHLPTVASNAVASNRRAAPDEQTSIAEAHRRPPLRILIAEDNKDAADMLAEVLKLSGDTVQVCLRRRLRFGGMHSVSPRCCNPGHWLARPERLSSSYEDTRRNMGAIAVADRTHRVGPGGG